MKITVEIIRVFADRTDMLKAASNVILTDGEGDSLIIKNVRVIEGANGLFVSFPSRRNAGGEYREICYPVSPALRKRMSEAVLDAYEKAIQNTGGDRVERLIWLEGGTN